jgi:hypothetical protein
MPDAVLDGWQRCRRAVSGEFALRRKYLAPRLKLLMFFARHQRATCRPDDMGGACHVALQPLLAKIGLTLVTAR